jgi:hypothetical protein
VEDVLYAHSELYLVSIYTNSRWVQVGKGGIPLLKASRE